MKKILLLLILTGAHLYPDFSSAQGPQDTGLVCGTDLYRQEQLKKYPELKRAQQNSDTLLAQYRRGLSKSGHQVEIIPVVFHVIHQYGPENVPYDDFEDIMKTINEDFRKKNSDTSGIRKLFKPDAADCKIEFRLARVAPNGKCTNGTHRIASSLTEGANNNVKGLVQWDPDEYMNVWVVKSINLGGGGNVAGYAQLPWDKVSRPSTDGIVIRADNIRRGDPTLTHEIGHYLGLLHTFQGGCTTSDCRFSGDRVCDTPPEARKNTIVSCSEANTCNETPDKPDMEENHMNYTNCRSMLTYGQKSRMKGAIALYRAKLVSDQNLIKAGVYDSMSKRSPLAVISWEEELPVCAGSGIQFRDVSCRASVDKFKWYFPGGDPSFSTQRHPLVNYDSPGIYNVALSVENQHGKDSVLAKNAIRILPGKGTLYVPFAESFEGKGATGPNWYLPENGWGHRWDTSGKAAAAGSQSLYYHNYKLGEEGEEVDVILRNLDVSHIAKPNLSFKVAYAQRFTDSKDRLNIFVSNNCGKSWLFLKVLQYFQMETSREDTVAGEFVPGQDEWKEVTIKDLDIMEGEKNLFVRFRFTSDKGNNIYLDDIGVKTLSGLDRENRAKPSVTLYPNPVGQELHLKIRVNKPREVTIDIRDITGKEIAKLPVVTAGPGKEDFKFNISGVEPGGKGLYLMYLNFADQTIVKKFSLLR